MKPKIYCIDTSSLIAAWAEHYPLEHFPAFWDNLDTLIEAERIISPDLVRAECRDADLQKWLKQRPKLFKSREAEIQKLAASVLAKFPKLVALPKRNASADPFVIGLALYHGATIITQEGSGSPGKPTIPLVTKDPDFGCPLTNLLGLIRAEKWTFR